MAYVTPIDYISLRNLKCLIALALGWLNQVHCEMPIGRFIAGLIFTLVVVALWSWQDGAGAGTIVLRLVAAAFIVQFGYFVGIYILARREADLDKAETQKDAAPPAPATRRPSLDT